MINRDGFNTSLWQSFTNLYKPKSLTKPNRDYDVIVAGGGITGVSTALLLQQKGKRCLLVEARNLGFGTTGGTTAHLNTLLDTPYTTISKNFGKENARLVAQSVAEAIELIRTNIQSFDISCGFSEVDAYLFAQDEKQEKELDQIVEASAHAGLDIDFTKSIPVPMAFIKAARARGQAKFIPTAYLYGLAAAFEEAGGIILQDTAVTGVENNERVEVSTGVGTFSCVDLVYATHIPLGVNLLHLQCIPYRSYAMALRLNDHAYPDDLAYDMVDPYHYYRTQEIDNKLYLIAGGKDHKTAHEENTEKCLLELESHLRKYFSIREITHKWSSQYFEPADGLPYIGHLPASPAHIYIATGFGGNGMVYSSVAAIMLSKMICEEESGYERLFDPNRIKPIAGFSNFMQHTLDTAKQLLGKLLPAQKLSELAGLAAGEGKVVKYEEHKIAVYKDGDHVLHAVNPVCTHLKCDVQWNSTERSWDCPCHGARYDIDGTVLNGPADNALQRININ